MTALIREDGPGASVMDLQAAAPSSLDVCRAGRC